jgi:hypothetical protein
MATDTADMLRAAVRNTADEHDRLVALANGDGPDEDDVLWLRDQLGFDVDPQDYDSEDIREEAREYLDNDVLEIYGVWHGRTRDSSDLRGVVVVTGTGGPHIELDTAKGQWIGYWGGDTAYASASREVIDYWEQTIED